MTRFAWRITKLIGRTLDAAEREVVLGDIAEAGEGLGAAAIGVLGLALRRQAGLWMQWKPWFALAGVCGFAGAALSRMAFQFDVELGQQIMTHRRYGVRFETGLTAGQDVAVLVCLAMALALWSWTSGFVLGSFSGRAAWVTGAVFYVVVLNAAWARFVLSGNIVLRRPETLHVLIAAIQPVRFETILFSIPALWGARVGCRQPSLRPHAAFALGAVTCLAAVLVGCTGFWQETAREVWSGGMWMGRSWRLRVPRLVLASWPAAYLIATAWRNGKHLDEGSTT